MADEALREVVRQHSNLRRYYKAPIRNPIWLTTALAAIIVFASGGAAAALIPFIDPADPQRFPVLGGFVGLCAVLAAALGWGVRAGLPIVPPGRSRLSTSSLRVSPSPPSAKHWPTSMSFSSARRSTTPS